MKMPKLQDVSFLKTLFLLSAYRLFILSSRLDLSAWHFPVCMAGCERGYPGERDGQEREVRGGQVSDKVSYTRV